MEQEKAGWQRSVSIKMLTSKENRFVVAILKTKTIRPQRQISNTLVGEGRKERSRIGNELDRISSIFKIEGSTVLARSMVRLLGQLQMSFRFDSAGKLVFKLVLTCCILLFCLDGLAAFTFGQEPELNLKARQRVFLNNLSLLEKKLLVLSDFERDRNRSRSELLKKGLQLAQAKELLFRVRNATQLIEGGKSTDLRKAIEIQKSVLIDLESLYSLLESENPQKSARDKQKKIRKRIDRIEQIIRQQQAIRDGVETDADFNRVKSLQENVKRQTTEVQSEVESEIKSEIDQKKESSGAEREVVAPAENNHTPDSNLKPEPGAKSTGNEKGKARSPEQRIAKNLGDALKRMSDVGRKLASKKLADAKAKMEEAEEQLEQAKTELENILRQEREQEIESTLRTLEERFKLMLQMQLELNSKTLTLAAAEKTESEKAIESFGIASLQKKGMLEADKALLMLNEEGSSFAIAGTLRQIRSDMEKIKERLEVAKVDSITEALQKDVAGGLNDLVAALQTEQKENGKSQNGRAPSGEKTTQTVEQRPLLQKIAELKIIRQVQLRINARHKLYANKLKGKTTPEENETLAGLTKELSKRQKLLQEMTIKLNSETQSTRSP